MKKQELSWKAGGQQGEGLESLGEIFAAALCSLGYDVYGYRQFSSRIKGGHTSYKLRIANHPVATIASSCNAKMPEQMAAVQALPAVFAYDFGEKEKYRTDAYYDEVCHGIDLAMLSCKPMDKAAFAELCAPLHRRGVVHVLATMGAAGQMLSVQGKIVEKTTQMVEASDTMGAGDSFLAAFLCSLYTAGWQKAKPMPEQALLAALAAGQQVSARNCMAQGGFGCKAEISRDSIE